MNKLKILKYIEDTAIYQRGLDYFRNGYVVNFSKKNGNINAFVLGSERRPYQIKIFMNEEKDVVLESECTCPYYDDYLICKHIAAVLLYDSENSVAKEIVIVTNPILTDKEVFSSENIINLISLTNEGNKQQINEPAIFLGLQNNLNKIKNDERYCLVFAIEFEQSLRYNEYSWFISPQMAYIKKDNSIGRFANFNFEKITEPITDFEKNLLYKITQHITKKENIANYFEFIINNKISNIYLKSKRDYQPVVFEEIKKINIHFQLLSINSSPDFNKHEILFSPVICVIGEKNSYTVIGISQKKQIVHDGFNTMLIDNTGKIFYKINHELIFSVINYLFEKQQFKYDDIEKIKNQLNEITVKEKIFEIIFKSKSIRITYPIPKPFMEIDDKMSFELWFDYSGKYVRYGIPNGELIDIHEKNDEYILAETNKEYEEKINKFLFFKFGKFFNSDFYSNIHQIKNVKNINLYKFLVEHGVEIIDQGIDIKLKNTKNKISKNSGKVSIKIESKIDWLDIKAEFLDKDGNLINLNIDPHTLETGLIEIGNSYSIIQKEDIEKLKMLLNEGMSNNGNLQVSKYRYDIIHQLYDDIRNKNDKEIELIAKIGHELKNFDKIENYPLPAKSNSLRHYQHAGYNWLHFLNKYKLNGCLADDMGLGKTIQVLYFLKKLKEEKKLFTSLVVVPVNILTNWESEINKWSLKITYLLHFGQSRTKDIENLKKHDLIIVSYQTLRNDIELFNKLNYYYIILDEAQNIKNFESLAFKAVKTLKSDYRLSITGTPVENNTLELWSQMDFLNPGLLGSVHEFKNKFAKPIEVYGDKIATENLKKRVFPFILRRKKEEVTKELPEKTEIILYSEMSDEQKKVYEEYRDYAKASITKKINTDGVEKSAIEIFAALLKLRQIALFPTLVDNKLKDIPSCKFENLKTIVEEILEEDHKILIFSQFVEPLKIIENFIKKANYKYSYIDGSISAGDRKKEIESFQNDENVKLFLLSLRAGGVGINLTSADYVILFDPWWNPAIEAQAIDRAHRIGQTKKVIAYKMIVKNTVEEKILELQEKKKNLIKELITAESSFFKSLGKNDIINLFS